MIFKEGGPDPVPSGFAHVCSLSWPDLIKRTHKVPGVQRIVFLLSSNFSYTTGIFVYGLVHGVHI